MAETSRTTAGKRLAQQAGYFIREHSEQKFSLSGIASALFVNGNYLARVFKRETGHTLLWYHNAIPAHFSHLFKKMTGIAPSDWRAPDLFSIKDPIDFTGLM